MKLQLTVESGTLAGRTFDLEFGFITIGRSDTCSVRLDPLTERVASKQHAFIEARPGGFFITDNRSTNGTLVNGERIQTAKLKDGDRIQFGINGVTALIRISGAPGSEIAPTAAKQNDLERFEELAAREPVNLQSSLQNFALGSMSAAAPKVAEERKGSYVIPAITILVVVFLSLVVMLLISSALSPTGADEAMTLNAEGVITAFMASFVAFIPAVIYIFPLVWLDRYDPEPLWLLALAFAWGALVSVIVSFLINTGIGSLTLELTRDPMMAQAVGAVVSAPIFEEASKGIGLLILLIFFRRYFDDILDGIVFAGVIALGFATVENVLYYGRAIGGGGAVGLAFLFVLRGVLSPFAHVTFTAMTGIGCGIARESHNTAVRIIMPILGYIGAVVLHAIWNGTAVLGGLGGFALGYIVLQVPFFLIFVTFSLYIMWRQNRILKEMLAIDIARGLIPQEHAKIATSAFSSSAWVIGGLFNGKFKARSSYVRAIGKLGLSYWHIQRATAAQGETGSFQQNPILREQALRWRDEV